MALNRESRLSTGATDLFDEALEEDEDDFESTGTEEDLISTVDPEIFDRTFEVTKSDVPLAVGDEIPILRPWQGIPRMAMVFNFNYVWDSEEEKWVKDEGNGGGGGATTLEATGTQTINADDFEFIGTGVTDPALAVIPVLGWPSASDVPINSSINFLWEGGAPGSDEIFHQIEFDDSGGTTGTREWLIFVDNGTSGSVTIEWNVLSV